VIINDLIYTTVLYNVNKHCFKLISGFVHKKAVHFLKILCNLFIESTNYDITIINTLIVKLASISEKRIYILNKPKLNLLEKKKKS
jgi:hypothetical protein